MFEIIRNLYFYNKVINNVYNNCELGKKINLIWNEKVQCH